MRNNDQRCSGSSSSCSSKKNKSSSSSNSNSNSNSNNSSNSNISNNLEKPKQPQRGLGVAQLEKIRLHTQMANCGLIPQQQHHHHHGFPNPFFPYVNEDMRIQAGGGDGYQAAVQSSSTPFGYGPPPPYGSSMAAYGGYHHHPNNTMIGGVGEHMERTCNIKFGESHPSMTTSNNNVVAVPENYQYIQQQGLVTRHLLSHVEQNDRGDNFLKPNGAGSSKNNLASISENEEVNLELKL